MRTECGADHVFPWTGGRTIVHVALGGEPSGSDAAGRAKRARKPAKISPGTIISAKVTNVHATHAGVELDSGTQTLLPV